MSGFTPIAWLNDQLRWPPLQPAEKVVLGGYVVWVCLMLVAWWLDRFHR